MNPLNSENKDDANLEKNSNNLSLESSNQNQAIIGTYNNNLMQGRIKDVGIVAIDCYYPLSYVSQSEFENHLGISKGKYTIGLGQNKMAFCTDREDVVSIAMTVLSKLVKNWSIDYKDIGRLEVATETLQDHSKSIKTYLMSLFEESGNSNVEGIDCMNACYAGTNALFNSCAWVESSDWNNKLAVVIAVDIAEYDKGPARPTGGCGAVAIAIGPNSPIPFETQCRFSHMQHTFDFYKPDFTNPYPIVDGNFSNLCFFRSLDKCYQGFVNRYKNKTGDELNLVSGSLGYVIFHAPYNKLVQKSLSRLLFNDYLKYPQNKLFDEKRDYLNKFTRESSIQSKELVKELIKISKKIYTENVEPSTRMCKQLGNTYTASLYFGLISLIASFNEKEPINKRITLFSYGSGIASTMFSMKISSDFRKNDLFKKITKCSYNAYKALNNRKQFSPSFFIKTLDSKKKLFGALTYRPKGDINDVAKGVFVLDRKDEKGRKFYIQNES